MKFAQKLKEKVIIFLLKGILVMILLFILAFFIKPLGNFYFSFLFGKWYYAIDETSTYIGDKQISLSIYKSSNKPFLLLGPVMFEKGYYDFFFVNKEMVIRTAIDKGGDTWCRFGCFLFILDDLSSSMQNRLRAPWWNDIKADDLDAIVFDASEKVYKYSFKINNNKDKVLFSIPTQYFSKDMTNFEI